MIHYTEIEHYIHLSLLNFYQHAYKTCMSFTDDAVISESQASLSVVILILDTHQDVSLCIFSLSITMRSSTTFSYVTIPSALSTLHFPSLPCSSGLPTCLQWCPSSHCGQRLWPWRALAEEHDPTGAAGSWKRWLTRWLSHIWEKIHNVKQSYQLLTSDY